MIEDSWTNHGMFIQNVGIKNCEIFEEILRHVIPITGLNLSKTWLIDD